MSGSITEVETVLERWDLSRARDPRTGEITHPAVVVLVDCHGRVAYVLSGGAEAIAALARGL